MTVLIRPNDLKRAEEKTFDGHACTDWLYMTSYDRSYSRDRVLRTILVKKLFVGARLSLGYSVSREPVKLNGASVAREFGAR